MLLIRTIVFVAMVANFCLMAFWVVKMIREINAAEGQPGRIPLRLIIFSRMFLVSRHSHSPILRRNAVALAVLVALAGSSRAFCGEIHDAARDGVLEKVKVLLAINPALVSVKDEGGMTALHWAVDKDHKAVVDFLLANKADVNARDSRGMTPLHFAAEFNYTDVAESLLRSGADVNAKTSDGRTPFFSAVAKGSNAVAELLLAAAGADVNSRDMEGETPLHRAVLSGNAPDEYHAYPKDAQTQRDRAKEMVELLLTNKADINARDNDGHTPWVLARIYGRVDLLKLLLAKVDSGTLAGDLHDTTDDALEAIGRVRLLLADPTVAGRMPGIAFLWDIKDTSQWYQAYAGANPVSVNGEQVSLALRQGSGGPVLATQDFSSSFPQTIRGSGGIIFATVDISKMVANIFGLSVFSEEDLVKLSQSKVPEIRAAAAANFRDQTDKDAYQARFVKIVLGAKDMDTRKAALKQLDQATLGKIAIDIKGLEDFELGFAVVEKVADQGVLARIALEAQFYDTREAAISKLTDKTVLAKIAAEDKDAGVRERAKRRLGDLQR